MVASGVPEITARADALPATAGDLAGSDKLRWAAAGHIDGDPHPPV